MGWNRDGLEKRLEQRWAEKKAGIEMGQNKMGCNGKWGGMENGLEWRMGYNKMGWMESGL